MTLRAGAIVPHPPVIIPEIGGNDTVHVEKTVSNMREIAVFLNALDVETLIIGSPHSMALNDGFIINDYEYFEGDFGRFGYYDIKKEADGDGDLAGLISDECRAQGITAIKGNIVSSVKRGRLDHGVLVPFFFISELKSYNIIPISISGLSLELHYEFGKAIGSVCAREKKRIAFIASGDLSHALKPGAPAGYSPRGEVFDREVERIIAGGDLKRLLTLDKALTAEAAECGLRSFVILAGVLEGNNYRTETISYEGPFGVGYLTAKITIEDE